MLIDWTYCRACLSMSIHTVVAVILLCAHHCSPAAAQTLTFEDQPDLTQITSEYSTPSGAFPGVTFAHTTVRTRDPFASPDEFPPHSGDNIVFDEDGPISGTFTTPATGFGGYFTYNAPVTIRAFDASDNLVAVLQSLFTENYTSSGNPTNEFLQVSYAPGIKRFEIEANSFGDSIAMDDFFATDASAVPEPGAMALFVPALGVILASRRRKRSPS